ncbi:MAG TPA: hypothetical protein PKH39_01310 [Woeseiaceae bacterium]|nr:hypothetical protein [Woeseiaceae bacterium]
MNKIKVVLSLFFCIFLCSCGGGGSAPAATPPVVTPSPPPVAKLGGFWSGEMVIDAASGSEECGALITEDGQFRFLCIFTDLHLVGTSTRNQSSLTGSGLALSSLVFLDGSFVSDLTVNATLIDSTSLVGTWTTASAGDSGSFDMIYDPEYERDSSLALLEGTWASFDALGNPDATFSIDNLGVFTATNSNGCVSSGTILVLDDRYNLYQADSTITGCPIAGTYSGMALVFDDQSVNDSILLTINNNERAIMVGLEKQP